MSLLADERHQLFLSAPSSWEIALKLRRGRMQLPYPPDEYIPDRMPASGIDGLPVQHSHALHMSHPEDHHSDPFDRLIVSQAILEDLQIISADRSLSAYEVEWIDATR